MFLSSFRETLSGPLALFGFSPFNSLRTSLVVIDISSICLKGLSSELVGGRRWQGRRNIADSELQQGR